MELDESKNQPKGDESNTFTHYKTNLGDVMVHRRHGSVHTLVYESRFGTRSIQHRDEMVTSFTINSGKISDS